MISTFALCMAGTAQAGIPLLNASCPGGIEVHADKGGPVYINGKEAKLKKYNENSFDAKGSDVTVSIDISPDGSPSILYTGKHGANGVCQLSDSGVSSSNKAQTAPPAVEPSAGSGKVVAPGNMPAFCRGEASSQFATKPDYVKTGKLIQSATGYIVKGTADLGNAGNKPFQCEFSKKGEFLHLKSLVDEGKL